MTADALDVQPVETARTPRLLAHALLTPSAAPAELAPAAHSRQRLVLRTRTVVARPARLAALGLTCHKPAVELMMPSAPPVQSAERISTSFLLAARTQTQFARIALHANLASMKLARALQPKIDNALLARHANPGHTEAKFARAVLTRHAQLATNAQPELMPLLLALQHKIPSANLAPPARQVPMFRRNAALRATPFALLARHALKLNSKRRPALHSLTRNAKVVRPVLPVNTSSLLARRMQILSARLAPTVASQPKSSRKRLVLPMPTPIVMTVKSVLLGLTKRRPAARLEIVNAKLVPSVGLELTWLSNVLERKTLFAELARVARMVTSFPKRALHRRIRCAHLALDVVREPMRALLVTRILTLNALLAPPALMGNTSLLLALRNKTRSANLVAHLVPPDRTNPLVALQQQIKTEFALLAQLAVTKRWKLLHARTQLTDSAKIVLPVWKERTRWHHAKAHLTQIVPLAARVTKTNS